MPLQIGVAHEKAGDDVPLTDGGTGASDAVTALGNLGHGTTDHTGITGVGSDPTTTTLTSSATVAQINAALAANDIVYLRPGAYPTYTSALTVPTNKALIGLHGGGDHPDANGVRLSFNIAAGSAVFMNGYAFKNMIFNVVTGASTGNFFQIGTGAGERIEFHNITVGLTNLWQGIVIEGNGSKLFDMRNVNITEVPQAGSTPVVNLSSGGAGGPNRGQIIENVHIKANSAQASGKAGFRLAGSYIVNGCSVIDMGGTGFELQGSAVDGFALISVVGCRAENTGSHGFHDQTGGGWYTIHGNTANNCTGTGFLFGFGGTGNIGSVVGNKAAGNGTNFTLGAGYINSANV